MLLISFFFLFLILLTNSIWRSIDNIYNLSYFNFQSCNNKCKQKNKCLVISFALNYNYSRIENFILSLNKTKYIGDILIFTFNSSNLMKRTELLYKIYYIQLMTIFPYYPYDDINFPISKKNILKNLYYYKGKSFVTYRYFIIKLFIKYFGSKYKYILLTDVRDVLFQLNPFNWNIFKGIYIVEEHPKRKIENDKSNLIYVKLYNPSKKLLNSLILNGGIIFGTYPEFFYFLDDFLSYICIFNCNGNDQGGLNSFIRNLNFFHYPIYLLNSSHTPVKTLALWLFDSQKCCIPYNNIIYNYDNSIPHIIHQYDRAIRAAKNNHILLEIYNNYVNYNTEL